MGEEEPSLDLLSRVHSDLSQLNAGESLHRPMQAVETYPCAKELSRSAPPTHRMLCFLSISGASGCIGGGNGMAGSMLLSPACISLAARKRGAFSWHIAASSILSAVFTNLQLRHWVFNRIGLLRVGYSFL